MHSLPNFLEGESRHKSSTKQQQTHVGVRHPWETFSLISPRSAHQSPLSVNHQIFTSFGPWRSFLSSCYWISSKLSKWRILVPIWLCTTITVTGHMLFIKSSCACSYKKDHYWLFITLSHTVEFLWFSSVVVDKFTASFEILSGLIKWFKWLMVMKMCGLCVSKRHWSQHSVFSTWH